MFNRGSALFVRENARGKSWRFFCALSRNVLKFLFLKNDKKQNLKTSLVSHPKSHRCFRANLRLDLSFLVESKRSLIAEFLKV